MDARIQDWVRRIRAAKSYARDEADLVAVANELEALLHADAAHPLQDAGGARELIEQAARLLRCWAGDRQRANGKWTLQEQAGVNCAIGLEELLHADAAHPRAFPADDLIAEIQDWICPNSETCGHGCELLKRVLVELRAEKK